MKWADKKVQWFKMMTCTKLFLQLKNRKAAKGREGVLDPFQTVRSWQGVEVNTIVLYSNNIWVCSAGRLSVRRGRTADNTLFLMFQQGDQISPL